LVRSCDDACWWPADYPVPGCALRFSHLRVPASCHARVALCVPRPGRAGRATALSLRAVPSPPRLFAPPQWVYQHEFGGPVGLNQHGNSSLAGLASGCCWRVLAALDGRARRTVASPRPSWTRSSPAAACLPLPTPPALTARRAGTASWGRSSPAGRRLIRATIARIFTNRDRSGACTSPSTRSTRWTYFFISPGSRSTCVKAGTVLLPRSASSRAAGAVRFRRRPCRRFHLDVDAAARAGR